MDSRKFVTSLTAQQKQQLTEKYDRNGFQSLVFHFGGIGVLVHRSRFATASLNQFAGLVCGYLIFLPA